MSTTVKKPLLATFAVQRPGDYLELCKPRVVSLIVFTAVVGMLLSTDGWVPVGRLLFGTVGIALAAASAAALNHVLDRRIDARMRRTHRRPLPRGNVTEAQALTFASLLGIASMALLTWLVNPLTALLTFATLIGYGVIYTLFLKHATPQNIVIGGASGAAPPVLGWAAVTGEVSMQALLLFLIIFTWTPPHFWALAIARRDDYARAGVPMLPVTHGEDFTRLQILLYTVLMVIATLLPYLTGMSGLVYLAGALVLDAGFLYYAVALMVQRRPELPMRTFSYSVTYLAGLFAVILADHYIGVLLA